jgi:hypothetical protein
MTPEVFGSPFASIRHSAQRTTEHRRRAQWLGLVAGNVAGAAFAVYLLLPNLRFFFQIGRPIGLVFAIQQVWVPLYSWPGARHGQ